MVERDILEILVRAGGGTAPTGGDLASAVGAWVEATADDAQLSALLMAWAVAGRGADTAAVEAVCRSLVASGDRLELSTLGPVVDAQCTGATGDSSLLVAAPLAASLGARVAICADPGLGPVSGLLDRLEAIPGLRAHLDLRSLVRQVSSAGIAITARDDRLAPAERRLYGLAESVGLLSSPLVAAVAAATRAVVGGAPGVVAVVQGGAGATVRDRAEADVVASAVRATVEAWGRSVRALRTDDDEPLGAMVGGALEVRGAGEVLVGSGAPDLRERAILVAGAMAEAAGVLAEGTGADAARAALDDGRALASAERWMEAQGGDPGVWQDVRIGTDAPLVLPVLAPADGRLGRMDGGVVGAAARWVGAGRMHPAQVIDPVVGVRVVAKVGDDVVRDEPVAFVHARDAGLGERAVQMIEAAVAVDDARAA